MHLFFPKSRIWIALVAIGLLILLAWFLVFHTNSERAYSFLPPQTALMVECNGLSKAEQAAVQSTDPAWREIWQTGLFTVFQQDVALAAHLFDGNPVVQAEWMHLRTVAAFTLLPADSLHPLLVTDFQHAADLPELLRSAHLPNGYHAARFHGFELFTVVFSGRDRLVLAQSGNFLLISRASYLVEEALEQQHRNNPVFAASSQWDAFQPEAPIRMVIRMEQAAPLLYKSLKPGLKSLPALLLRNIPWAGLAFDGHKTEAIAGAPSLGPAMENWGTANAQNLFGILPEITAFVGWVGFDNQIPFWDQVSGHKNEDFQQYIQPWAAGSAAFVVTNPFTDDIRDNQFIVLATRDSTKTVAALEAYGQMRGLLRKDDYQTFTLYQFASNTMLTPIVGETDAFRNPVCTMIGPYVVFAGSRSALELWIDMYIVNTTLASNPDFIQAYAALGSGYNGLLLFNTADLRPLLRQLFDAAPETLRPNTPDHLSRLGLVALGLQAHGDLLNIRVSMQQHQELPAQPSLLWKTTLEADAIQPFALTAPNGEDRLLVQDDHGTLYCLDTKGAILWKRAVGARIIGGISAVDFYANGAQTYLFNTPQQIWMLDQQGQNVEGYPFNLLSPATNAVAAVDFDHDRKYNYFVGCRNGNVYGFDQFGRPLQGWNPQTGTGTVKYPMLHFQYEQKDYCCMLNDAGKLHVFARNGARRFPPVQLEGKFISPPHADYRFRSPGIACFNSEGAGFTCDGNTGAILHTQSKVNQPGRILEMFKGNPDSTSAISAILGNNMVYTGGFGGVGGNCRLPGAQDTLFEAGPDAFGTLQRAKSKIFLINTAGQLQPGFPLAGTTPFVVCSPGGGGPFRIVVTGYGSNLYAYKVR